MSVYANEFCMLCNEWTTSSDELAQGVWSDELGQRRKVHRECALRNVVGGIGHLKDHYLWCITCKDPDGGLSYRQSAIEVDAWIRKHGVPS